MRDYVLLYLNGRRLEVRGSRVFEPLSDFLREAQRLTGTKVVCAEGDCGACMVLVGRPRNGQIVYRPIAACIQYVAQLDGAHVVSVEGLSGDGNLNPIQEALVAHHGAQCGFCTPGFVVSLCSLLDAELVPAREDVARALVGNLCRCTGYDSILQATAHVDRTAWQSVSQRYPASEMQSELERAAGESVSIVDSGRRLVKPATLADAVRVRAAEPEAVVLAGGTDLGVVWNKGHRRVGTLLCVGELPELRGCAIEGGRLVAGSAATIGELEQAAAVALPGMRDVLDRFGSPPIKNAGTVGGNLATGSPIGDTMPAWFALDAEVELAGPRGSRRVNINRFYTGYRQNVLAGDELIVGVSVPLPAGGERFAAYKVSKRRDLDISTVAAAIWMSHDGELIRAARIALGGVAATIVRLPRTEAWLSERRLNEATLREAGRMAREEVAPISDVRGSVAYRLALVENLIVKFGREAHAAEQGIANGKR